MDKISTIYGKNPSETLVDFIGFACKHLKLKSIPKFEILDKPISNKESNSFAAYSPPNKTILIYTKHRHILDICRSICHELVHYKQDLKKELNSKSGITGSDHENEANSLAGQIMRLYSKDHLDLF